MNPLSQGNINAISKKYIANLITEKFSQLSSHLQKKKLLKSIQSKSKKKRI